MNEFRTYHPIVNFIYFVLIIGFSCFFMHPICLVMSFLGGFLYLMILKGRKAFWHNLIYTLPMIIIMALLNSLFNHKGTTILFYLPSGNPLTLESIFYGISAAVMIISVISWFSCYNKVMTSDKFIYLFGKIIPSLALILSMTLRFVPKFTRQFKIVADAQKCIGRDMGQGNIVKKMRNGLLILSIMTTWALENAIETADSMKSRGYGVNKRTAFSTYKFDKRDACAFLCIIFFGIYILLGSLAGEMKFEFFPFLRMTEFSLLSTSVFVAYGMLCIFPVIIELREARRWKVLRSKI